MPVSDSKITSHLWGGNVTACHVYITVSSRIYVFTLRRALYIFFPFFSRPSPNVCSVKCNILFKFLVFFSTRCSNIVERLTVQLSTLGIFNICLVLSDLLLFPTVKRVRRRICESLCIFLDLVRHDKRRVGPGVIVSSSYRWRQGQPGHSVSGILLLFEFLCHVPFDITFLFRIPLLVRTLPFHFLRTTGSSTFV